MKRSVRKAFVVLCVGFGSYHPSWPTVGHEESELCTKDFETSYSKQ